MAMSWSNVWTRCAILLPLLLCGCTPECDDLADRLQSCPVGDAFASERIKTDVIASWRDGDCSSESAECADCYLANLRDDCSDYYDICLSECAAR